MVNEFNVICEYFEVINLYICIYVSREREREIFNFVICFFSVFIKIKGYNLFLLIKLREFVFFRGCMR